MTRTIKCSSKYFDINMERKADYVRYTVLFLCLSTKIELVLCEIEIRVWNECFCTIDLHKYTQFRKFNRNFPVL